MNTAFATQRDERTLAVENASYRWAFLFLSFGILLLASWRSFVQNESPWDLLFLVILGGGIASAYQAFHQILFSRWIIASLSAVFIAIAIATGLVLLR